MQYLQREDQVEARGATWHRRVAWTSERHLPDTSEDVVGVQEVHLELFVAQLAAGDLVEGANQKEALYVR